MSASARNKGPRKLLVATVGVVSITAACGSSPFSSGFVGNLIAPPCSYQGDPSCPDAGISDAGSEDAGSTDAGEVDAGVLDAGNEDAGDSDAGS